MPAPPAAVHHVAIVVSDLARMERFYRDLLGLPLIRRWPAAQGGDRSVWLDLGAGAFLALELPEQVAGTTASPPSQLPEQVAGTAASLAPSPTPPKEQVPGTTTGLHLLALRILRSERDEWERRLVAAGHPVYGRTAYTLYVRDPEGNRVGLSHYPEP